MAADTTQTPEAVRTKLLGNLVELLGLEQIEMDLFRGGRASARSARVFGGQVIGQALMAACRTVPAERLPHSLHAYFMRAGDPAIPIVYQVAHDHDGGSFSSRRVVAIQHGKPILNLASSFHVAEAGLDHQLAMPDVPPPEACEDELVVAARHAGKILPARLASLSVQRPIEFRPTRSDLRLSGKPQEAQQSYWFRAVAPLPPDQVLHRVLLAYASDMMLLGASLLPHSQHWLTDPMQEASLDHALWIHRDLRVDAWSLYVQDSPWTGGARGLSRGLIYSRDGVLIASVAQEGLIRLLGGAGEPGRKTRA